MTMISWTVIALVVVMVVVVVMVIAVISNYNYHLIDLLSHNVQETRYVHVVHATICLYHAF